MRQPKSVWQYAQPSSPGASNLSDNKKGQDQADFRQAEPVFARHHSVNAAIGVCDTEHLVGDGLRNFQGRFDRLAINVVKNDDTAASHAFDIENDVFGVVEARALSSA